MKRLFFFLIAGITGWWGYSKLRSHPRTAGKVADLERQGQLAIDKAGDVARSATGQAASKAADMAGTAATGAQQTIGVAASGAQGAIGTAATGARQVIDTAVDKAHEVLDAAAQKTREAISPVPDTMAEMGDNAAPSSPKLPGPQRRAS